MFRWVVQSGETSISSSGRDSCGSTRFADRRWWSGQPLGTSGPVTMVGASLICGGSGGTVVPETGGVVSPSPLSSAGNAEIDQAVNLPATCLGLWCWFESSLRRRRLARSSLRSSQGADDARMRRRSKTRTATVDRHDSSTEMDAPIQ